MEHELTPLTTGALFLALSSDTKGENLMTHMVYVITLYVSHFELLRHLEILEINNRNSMIKDTKSKDYQSNLDSNIQQE